MVYAKVAIITRTKNRPITLERAIQSVIAQTYKDWTMVIVNDGGDSQEVERLVHKYEKELSEKVILVHHSESVGMEAASNVGIKSTNSEFVLIHDDDDTLEPSFLEKTVGFLETSLGKEFGGAATRVVKIDEEINAQGIRILGKTNWNEHVVQITLAEMAARNLLVPISVIYRRAIHEKIGFYNEDLPVLGDWEFYLRFLLEEDLFLINEPLANYHHRLALKNGIYSNTVIGGIDKHKIYEAKLRNHFLRNDIQKGTLGLGFLMNRNIGIQSPDKNSSLLNDSKEVIASLIKQLHSNNIRSVAVYGAGEFGLRLFEQLDINQIKVEAWIDSREGIWGTELKGIEVISIKEAVARNLSTFIVGSLSYVDAIVETIKTSLPMDQEHYRIFHV